MKVITANLNGIRAAQRKGFFEWATKQKADVICVQELKAQADQIESAEYHLKNYHRYLHCAEKKGYSGVGIYSRVKPDKVKIGLGWECADQEGRYIQADFGKLSVASLYLPSGTSGDLRQQVKFDFLDQLIPIFKKMRRQRREYILCGDWNIAHKKIDIKNWRSNQKNSGFLPEERAWLDMLYDELGFVDAFRQVNNKEEQYTWWSNRGRAWDNNVGWRLDYQVVTPGLKDKVKRESIYKKQRFSDHAPLIMEYDMETVCK